MQAWVMAHPWMTFLLGLTALNLIGYALSAPCEGWRALSPGCQPQTTGATRWRGIAIPAHNGVYHGLVRA